MTGRESTARVADVALAAAEVVAAAARPATGSSTEVKHAAREFLSSVSRPCSRPSGWQHRCALATAVGHGHAAVVAAGLPRVAAERCRCRRRREQWQGQARRLRRRLPAAVVQRPGERGEHPAVLPVPALPRDQRRDDDRPLHHRRGRAGVLGVRVVGARQPAVRAGLPRRRHRPPAGRLHLRLHRGAPLQQPLRPHRPVEGPGARGDGRLVAGRARERQRAAVRLLLRPALLSDGHGRQRGGVPGRGASAHPGPGGGAGGPVDQHLSDGPAPRPVGGVQ